MALIPIASVPNAPQGVDVPLNQGGLRAAKVGNENQRAPDLSGVAESLMIPTIKQGAFDGPAEGLNALGKGISNLAEGGARVAAVLQHAAEVKSEFQDKVSIAQYTANREKENSAYESTLEGMPEADFVKNYEAGVGSMKERAAKGLTFSSRALGLKQLIDINFDSQTVRNLNSQSNRQTVERGRGVLMAEAVSSFENGNRDIADQKLDTLVTLGAVRKDQADKQKLAWDEITTNNTLTRDMTDNPKPFYEALVRYQDGEANDAFDILFAGPDKEIKLLRWKETSGQYLRGIQVEKGKEIYDKIITGEIPTEALLKEEVGNLFSDRQFKQWKDLMASNVKYDAKTTTELRTAIANYDVRKDKDLSIYYSLRGRIETTIAKDIQGPLSNELYQSYSSGKGGKVPSQAARLKASVFSTIDKLQGDGILGPTGTSREPGEKGKVINQDVYMESFVVSEDLKEAAEQYFIDNPEATPTEAKDWFKSVTGDMASDRMADEFKAQEEREKAFTFQKVYTTSVGMAPPSVGMNVIKQTVKGFNKPRGELPRSEMPSSKADQNKENAAAAERNAKEDAANAASNKFLSTETDQQKQERVESEAPLPGETPKETQQRNDLNVTRVKLDSPVDVIPLVPPTKE